MTEDICIGIDLGTTYSCVGVWIHGHGCVVARIAADERRLELLRPAEVVTDLKAALGGAALQKSKELLFAAVHLLGQVVGDDIGQVQGTG